MVRKADWMKRLAPVIVCGKKGIITKVETKNVDGETIVIYIYVKLNGGKFSNPYFPADVKRANK